MDGIIAMSDFPSWDARLLVGASTAAGPITERAAEVMNLIWQGHEQRKASGSGTALPLTPSAPGRAPGDWFGSYVSENTVMTDRHGSRICPQKLLLTRTSTENGLLHARQPIGTLPGLAALTVGMSTKMTNSSDIGEAKDPLPDSDPKNKRRFTPEVLDMTVIAIPLLKTIRREIKRSKAAQDAGATYKPPILDVIIDLNSEYEYGHEEAQRNVRELVKASIETVGLDQDSQGIGTFTSAGHQYVFARLEPNVISKLVEQDQDSQHGHKTRTPKQTIHRIWPDFEIGKLTTQSVSTVKADAARVSFSAFGSGIVWAVIDSGIQADHPHFAKFQTLELDAPLKHHDYTALDGSSGDPLSDSFGHGTHVAGIIAGSLSTVVPEDTPAPGKGSQHSSKDGYEIHALTKMRDSRGDTCYELVEKISSISGMAPKCKIISLKVLDADGRGKVSRLIAAIGEIQRVNNYGRQIRIHGVNLSVGYEFKPEWFACGQSPLCVEVDLLVRSGVVVVVAAGNTGYGYNQDKFKGSTPAGLDLTINDPGNAERAITVGATHRSMPHVYGVSYFSSKGPTGDGRLKPDLVAPGEKIISCAAGSPKEKAEKEAGVEQCDYIEDSGTSMAAPHVSGVIAAFLSVRREFIGKPDEVKEIFMSTATDLKRDRNFQGRGLVDLMRAIQSV